MISNHAMAGALVALRLDAGQRSLAAISALKVSMS
jgi:hypothetical protein